MLKIVEVHLSARACGEYIVLQNHGLTTVSMRGWALCTDTYLRDSPDSAAQNMLIFQEDIAIKPYTRIVVFTGPGENGWQPTTDGKSAYVVYWGREEPVWRRADNVHLLQVANSKRIVLPDRLIETILEAA